MKQKAFTDEAYRDLVKSIHDNRSHYEKAGKWLTDSGKHKSLFMNSMVNLNSTVSLIVPDGKKFYDYENATRIHKALELTPVVAADPRLWARLTHVECWDYMQKRWAVDEGKNARFIRERYFFAGTDSRALMRNGLSRLWWYANITFDPKRKNKYELTQAAFLKLDIAQNLLENSFGRSQALVHAYLEFVLKNREQCVDAPGNRERMRYIASCVNGRTGVAVVDTMSKKQTIEFLEFELARYDKENPPA